MNESFPESIRSFCLLNEPNDMKKDLFILMNKFEQESHEQSITEQSKASIWAYKT